MSVSLAMSRKEREEFLAGVRVGILSVAEEARGPLTLPIWYGYELGGEVVIVTERNSKKGKLLARAGRFSLCVQTEELPYKYVSVEGPVTSTDPADVEEHLRPIAHRYLGAEMGDQYIESTGGNSARDGSVVIRMRPEVWRTTDYAKQYADQV